MRIGITIISIVLSVFALFEAWGVYVEGTLTNVKDARLAAAVGGTVAFGLLVGGAFAIGLPMVSLVIFTVVGAFALASVRMYPFFPDLLVWGWVCIALAAMATYGWWEKRRAEKPAN